MADQVETAARTVEEAVKLALLRLDATLDEVDIKIVDSGTPGKLLGLGAREARILVTRRASPFVGDEVEADLEPPPPAVEAPRSEAPPPPVEAPWSEPPPPAVEEPRSEAPPPAVEAPWSEPPPPAVEEPRSEAPPPAVEAPWSEPPPPAVEEPRSEAPPPAVEAPWSEPPPPAYVDEPEPMEDPEPVEAENLVEVASDLIQGLVDRMGFDATVETTSEDPLSFNVYSEDDRELEGLIGPRGENLRAFGFLLNSMLGRIARRGVRVFVDVNGYRQGRADELGELARRAAESVGETHEPVTLEAMPAHERRLVHITLAEHAGVCTYSVGQGKERQVVIGPED